MMKKNIFALTLLALTTVGITSCEDMLTGDMDRNVGIEEVASDTLYSYWGIYKSVQQVAERYVILGECRGDMVSGTEYVSDSISAILNFGMSGNTADGSNRFLKAADFYHIVNSCNAYINQADITTLSGLNKPIMRNEYAQVVAIRAWAYLQLVLTYGRVPYFEKPMLSTADMEEFRESTQYVDANTLATSNAVKMLDELRHIPSLFADDPSDVIAYPDYGSYGGNNIIAYASQCIFPQDLVLGDIWLLRAQGEGSEADYRQAAQYYYNYLNSERGGPLYPNRYYARFNKNQSTEQYYVIQSSWEQIFYSIAKPSMSNEVVTVIPSSKNKLNGIVFRAMNELFGFDQVLSVTGDSVGTGTIDLERNYQHQLDASKAYTNLNKLQDHEVYVGTTPRCNTYLNAGDVRYRMTTDTDADSKTGSADEISFVVKQNILGGTWRQFSSVYPIIYRKANIWLRFAEALNGAGFPGYAFAILRHGLVGSDGWVPKDADSYKFVSFVYYDPTDQDDTGAPIVVVNPNDPSVAFTFYDPTTATTDTDPVIYTDYKQFFDDMLHPGLEPLTTHADTMAYVGLHMVAETTTRELQAKTGIICKYIGQKEAEAASGVPFLNFQTNYLQGDDSNKEFTYYTGVTEYNIYQAREDPNPNSGAVTMGIHARGCGLLKLEEVNYGEYEDGTYGTHYNYVEQINRMRKRYEGATTDLSEKEIYDPANKRKVQEAIASLILEEMGLETAFEGNRFFDLLCYSRMIGGQKGVDRVAKMISERSGTTNSSLYSHLQNSDNWYFKLPNK